MNYFSIDYAQARNQFVEVAGANGAHLDSHLHALKGPRGENLAVDLAWFGSRDAKRAFVALSGVHGVEGFFGSAVQTAWMDRGEYRRLPDDACALLIHAINPFGFAWLRRTNEDNVDLNRNWINFASSVPENEKYEEIAADVSPVDWSEAVRAETGSRLAAWRERNGMPAYLQAVTSGQWRHADGLFYGGSGPSWSRSVLTEIVTTLLDRAQRVVMVDFHTGLGLHGYAEPIIHRRRDDPGFSRTQAWIGATATSIYGGGSISAEVRGDGISAIQNMLPNALVDAVSLECGVLSIDKVDIALRADNWLHAHGDPGSSDAADIKKLIRAAFHSDEPLWQGMALGQGLAACRAAMNGMSQPAA
ncbi:M14 family metallopeptidase [Caballeronia sordidicola]|uniref:M14 family metallopeptidase n=1 Tax=Caballeronia sordidicola TaxID=196367 RepID=UPI0004D039C0|nr:M14 family metallopeptidase [Caballeronia sordidicola]